MNGLISTVTPMDSGQGASAGIRFLMPHRCTVRIRMKTMALERRVHVIYT